MKMCRGLKQISCTARTVLQPQHIYELLERPCSRGMSHTARTGLQPRHVYVPLERPCSQGRSPSWVWMPKEPRRVTWPSSWSACGLPSAATTPLCPRGLARRFEAEAEPAGSQGSTSSLWECCSLERRSGPGNNNNISNNNRNISKMSLNNNNISISDRKNNIKLLINSRLNINQYYQY